MRRSYRNIARALRPHGRQGEVIVAALRGLPLLLEPGMRVALTPPALDRDRFCTVEAVAEVQDGARVRFSGIDGIEAAEGISNCFVLAFEDDLDLDPLTAAVDDLLGREVVDARFGSIGVIEEVMETPANDVWVVSGGAYGEVLVPIIEQVLDSIPSEGAIEVRLLDGLIDAPIPVPGAECGADAPEPADRIPPNA